ncbi:MAG: hypothetical protein HAW60_00390 [Bdellovibrionales bacterium]|nr:hypothetical protein [Bdellovibrionales bacterium]
MLKSLFVKLLSILRHCPICGQFYFSVNFTCKSCNQKLFGSINFSKAEVNLPFPVYSLWTWGKLDYFLSFLLYSLKGSGNSFFYKKVAEECFFQPVLLKKELIYIPAASRSKYLDHSGYFAKALADKCSSKFLNILCRKKNKKQKRLSRMDRLKNSTSLKNTISSQDLKSIGNKNIIFVDDVLTTGGTALSAYKALGCPKFFKVLVLAYRPKIR